MTSSMDHQNNFEDKFHCHSRKPVLLDKVARRQLIAVLVVCILFIIGEATGASLSKSLALFTDVLHMLVDLMSFIISLISFFLATKSSSRRMTFGYFRAEVIGALLSVFLIWLVTGVLCYMAVESIRNGHYKDVEPNSMLITACISVAFNIIMGVILHLDVCCKKIGHLGHNHSHGTDHVHNAISLTSSPSIQYDPIQNNEIDEDVYHAAGKPKNINVRAAFIHVIGDFIQSIGVLIASLIIKFEKSERFRLADPIMTFIFSVLVLLTTITILRDTFSVLLEASPRSVNMADVRQDLLSLENVKSIHNLNVWSLTMDKISFSVHLAVDTDDHQTVLERANRLMRSHYNFLYMTIQVEDYDENSTILCHQCNEQNSGIL